jgi:hypothetical protein
MTRLNIGLGLVSDLHQELGLRVNHMLQDALVDTVLVGKHKLSTEQNTHLHSTQIVRIRHKQILLSLRKQLIQHPRMQQCVVQIPMTRRIPVLLVIVSPLRARQQCLLVDTWVSRLIEGRDAELLVGVFLDDAKGVFVCVEGRHKDQGNVDLVGGIEVLDLTDCQVQESHVVFDLEGTFGPRHTCGQGLVEVTDM